MNRFPLPHGFAVTDVLDLSGRPDDGAAAVTITWESEPGKTELELTLDLPGRAASLVVMSAAGVLFPPVRIPFPRAEDRVAIRFEVDHGLVVISSGEAELKRLRLSSWPGSVRHVLVSGLTDITLAHRNNPINALNWRGAALPSGLPSRTDPLIGRERLLPGLSLIIRAKNESLNVEGCIGSVAGLAEEVIFVDNGSTDDTLAKAERLAA
ncbi:glycosyltransferase, partial [Enterovirga sp.]|uniref:glycosyltransferase n=1 Tax=Enterovirga sp. TaxID=2026350 RepID=UPI002625D8B4